MSLQVWLPLTKDLKQQGLLQTPAFSLSAFTQESGGKLGQYCYTDRGIIHFTEDFLANQWSLACWVKSTSWSANNDIILCKNASESTSSQFYLSIINGTSFNLGINGGSSNGAGSYSYTFSTNTWYHVAATYDGTNYAMYINGNQVKSGTCTTTKPTGLLNLGIGCRSTNVGGTASTGNANKRLNDVRIYNHCLSPMEVKQLSQGLVLHYPLSNGNLIDINNITDGAYLNSNGGITGTNGWCYTDYIPVYSNSQYICTGLSKGGSGTYIVLYDNTKTKTRTLLLTANQNLNITTSDIEKYIRLSIRELANELTTTAKFIYMPPIEYDCSGFCNNGTRTGTFTCSSDTPKYTVSQDCLGTNYIYLTPPSTEIQTIAVWVNWKAIPSSQSVIFVDYGSGMGLGLMNTGILCSTSGAGNSYTFSKANLVANTWYHFVVVKTGITTRKLYINGVEQTATSNTSNWSYSVNQLQLGKRSTTSDGFVGKLSDFRAYATALSADDVKSLYQNSAYIDSSGNVYGAIHTEV